MLATFIILSLLSQSCLGRNPHSYTPVSVAPKCADLICVAGSTTSPANCVLVWASSRASAKQHDFIPEVHRKTCSPEYLSDIAATDELATAIVSNTLTRNLAFPGNDTKENKGLYWVSRPRRQISPLATFSVRGPGVFKSPSDPPVTVAAGESVFIAINNVALPSTLEGGQVRAFTVTGEGSVRIGDMSYSLHKTKIAQYIPDKEMRIRPCVFIPLVRHQGCEALEFRNVYSGTPSAVDADDDTLHYYSVGRNDDIVSFSPGRDPINDPDFSGLEGTSGYGYGRNDWRYLERDMLDESGSSVPVVVEEVNSKPPSRSTSQTGDLLPPNGEKWGTTPDTPKDWSAAVPNNKGGFDTVGYSGPSPVSIRSGTPPSPTEFPFIDVPEMPKSFGEVIRPSLHPNHCLFPEALTMRALSGGFPVFQLFKGVTNEPITGGFTCGLIVTEAVVAICENFYYRCLQQEGEQTGQIITARPGKQPPPRSAFPANVIPMGRCIEFHEGPPKAYLDMVCASDERKGRNVYTNIYWCKRRSMFEGIMCEDGRHMQNGRDFARLPLPGNIGPQFGPKAATIVK
ncbi:hypothetical protein CDD82_3121 [Ophiocordyceps australis]|uniref:Uncharacterized protein n=1 Tax=Ophiocordyceps australis TaxID=1399860 RepID=A0A2C5ZT70_9HYPO|nr:hypothetical protein CDD82_3121 [Ophiocordyceps australis]